METPQATKPQKTSLKQILSQTNQVIKSNIRVFLSLGLLFLFPLAAATALFTALQSLPSVSTAAKILLFLGLSFSSLILSPSALGSISFAALRGLSGEKPSLSAAVKSLSSSFLPLLATFLAYQSIVSSAAIAFSLILISCLLGHTTNDHDHDHQTADTPSLLAILIFTALFVVLLTYLQVIWSLAYPVAAFESAWGFAALKRSKTLVNGKRWLVLSLSLVFGIFYFLVFYNISRISRGSGKLFGGTFRASSDGSDWWSQLIVKVVVLLFNAWLMTLIQLYNIVAITVLYAYCSKASGLGGGDDFSGEYFSLPVNDKSVDSLA